MKASPWYRFMLPAAVLAIALGGCGSDEEGGGDEDAGTTDTGTGDIGADTPGEDTGTDTPGEDTGTDTPGEDTGTDTPGEDTGTDTGEDTGTDTGADTDAGADADGGTDADGGGDTGSTCGDGVVDPEEECDDGNTDDGDGCAADCTFEGGRNCDPCVADEDCAGPAICHTYVADAVCSEPCEDDIDCATGYSCIELFNDADESLGSYCVAPDGCSAIPESDCTDGVDNDGDDAIDCADVDCALDPACVVDPEICDDEIDNDGDGDIDCDDADCAGTAACGGGDTCEGVTPIALDDEFTGNSVGGSAVYSGSCGAGANGPEVIYSYTPADDISVCISMGGSSYDTVLHVRAGDCATGDEVACNDDNFAITDGTQSALEVAMTGGTTYYIFADTYGTGTGGDYAVRMYEGPCVPDVETSCTDGVDNDDDGDLDCADADCADAFGCGEICDDGEDDDDDGNTDCFDSECADDPYCSTFEWDCTDGDDEDGDDLVDCADDDCAEFIGCVPEVCDDGIDNNENGDLDCFDEDCADDPYCSSFEWNCEDGLDNDGDELTDCDDDECSTFGPCYDVRSCDDPALITLGETVEGSVIAGGADYTGTCAGAGPETVFSFTPEVDGVYCGSLGRSSYDTVLYVREATCADGEEVACDDDNFEITDGTQSAFSTELVGGTEYFFFVDTFSSADGAGGDFVFTVYEGECVPSFEASCFDGEDNDGDELVDCADDDCADSLSCGEDDCEDGVDNDFDGSIDCFDSECVDTEYCTSFEWNCNDGDDEDGDELIDCADDDCAEAIFCQPEVCDDGEDNDADDAIDCFDDECAEDPYCSSFEWNCADGIDNDGDEATDCDDDECTLAPGCFDAPTCETPATVTIGDEFAGNLDGLTGVEDYSSECSFGDGGPEAVYVFTPEVDGDVCFTTGGSEFDTVLHIREATCGDVGAEIACDDDSDLVDGTQSTIDLAAVAGTTYYVIVDSFGPTTGVFNFRAYEGPCVLEYESDCADDVDNDDNGLTDCDDVETCGDAIVCQPEVCDDGEDNNGNGLPDCFDPECEGVDYCSSFEWNCADGIDNDDDSFVDCDDTEECAETPVCAAAAACDAAMMADGTGTYSGDTTDSGNAFASDCGFSEEANDQAWTFVAPTTGTYCFDTFGTTFDTVIYLQTTCGLRESEIICNDDTDLGIGLQSEIQADLTEGETYTVVVDGYADDEFGPYTLNIAAGECDGI